MLASLEKSSKTEQINSCFTSHHFTSSNKEKPKRYKTTILNWQWSNEDIFQLYKPQTLHYINTTELHTNIKSNNMEERKKRNQMVNVLLSPQEFSFCKLQK